MAGFEITKTELIENKDNKKITGLAKKQDDILSSNDECSDAKAIENEQEKDQSAENSSFSDINFDDLNSEENKET